MLLHKIEQLLALSAMNDVKFIVLNDDDDFVIVDSTEAIGRYTSGRAVTAISTDGEKINFNKSIRN